MRILILSFYLGRQFWWLKERSHAKGFAQWHVVLSNVSSYYCASTKMNPCSSAFSRFYLSGSSTVLRAQERGLDFKYHQSSVSVHPSWPEVTALLGCGSQFSVKDQTVNILGLGARRVFHHISSFASFFHLGFSLHMCLTSCNCPTVSGVFFFFSWAAWLVES